MSGFFVPRIRWIAGMILIVLIVSVWWQKRGAVTRSSPAVIIYLIDTLRADRLGIYNYDQHTSPNIDALAAESVVFDQAYAPAPWTLPSVASFLTSTFVCEHGLNGIKKNGLNPNLKTLPERIKDAGYVTGGYYTNAWVGPIAGLDRGYDFYTELGLGEDDFSGHVKDFLSEHSGNPYFLYLHTMEPHDIWNLPYEYIDTNNFIGVDDRENYRQLLIDASELRQIDFTHDRLPGTTDNTTEQIEVGAKLAEKINMASMLYDGAVRLADTNLGKVIDQLKKAGEWDRSVFVFLSDHGEEFGERGNWFHGHSVYEEMIRVPLIVHFPNSEFAGQHVGAPVSLVDVMPTLLELLEIESPCGDCRGRSLLPFIQSNSPNTMEYTATIESMRMEWPWYFKPWQELKGRVNIALRKGKWKGIWNAELEQLELYDLQSDHAELSDVRADNPQLANELSNKATEWLGECRNLAKKPVEVPEAGERTKEKLRALGYFN
jgi:arylsulfatase A-like enzyme